MVAATLSKTADDRRCYRKVGDVLVERTVKEVRPAIAQNIENVSRVAQAMERAVFFLVSI